MNKCQNACNLLGKLILNASLGAWFQLVSNVDYYFANRTLIALNSEHCDKLKRFNRLQSNEAAGRYKRTCWMQIKCIDHQTDGFKLIDRHQLPRERWLLLLNVTCCPLSINIIVGPICCPKWLTWFYRIICVSRTTNSVKPFCWKSGSMFIYARNQTDSISISIYKQIEWFRSI